VIRVTFTAARELSGLHAAGDAVTISFSAAELTPGRVATKDQQVSLAGRRETLFHNAKRTWQVFTGPLERQTLEDVMEFLASCEGGETFSFEPWRYELGASLDLDFTTGRLRVAEVVSCVIEGDSVTYERLVGEGTGGADDVYQVGFRVVEA
jgi:hypothetical protein